MSNHAPGSGTRSAPWTHAQEASGLTSRLILGYAEHVAGASAVDAILERCGLEDYADDLRDESFWFDFDTKIRLLEAASEVLDDPHAARHIGAAAFDVSVFAGLKLALRAVGSPRLVYSGAARHGWRFTTTHRLEVLRISGARALIRYKDISGIGYHPLDCEYTVGLLSSLPPVFGRPRAEVRHSECALEGAEACIYDVRWEPASRVRRTTLAWTAGSVAALGAAAAFAPRHLRAAGAVPAIGTALIGQRALRERRWQNRALEAEVRDQKELAERLAASLRDLVCDLRLDEVLAKVLRNAQAALPGREFALLVMTQNGWHCTSSSRVPRESLQALEAWATQHPEMLHERVTLEDLLGVAELSSLPRNAFSPLGALHSAPLVFRGDGLGALVGLGHGEDGFLPQERAMLDAYADQVALALANARLFAQLEDLARRDSLTGLFNRREFHMALARELERAEHYGHPLSVVMLDLDGFKQVNDKKGHAEGDALLRTVAGVLEECCREAGHAYRVGGDEFALLLVNAGADAGRELARKVDSSLARLRAGITASFGFAVWPEDGPTENLLLFNADRALYDARGGRGHEASEGAPAAHRERPQGALDMNDHHLKTVTRALARAVDAKDSYTRSHCETVSEVCGLLGARLGFAPARLAKLRLAGLLHDVGKIGIPDAILQKPRPLTDEEFEVMKTHSTLGATIVTGAELVEEAVWVRYHHERIDGRGYPDGIAGEEIPIESRVILVADAFEALTSDRPYRRGRSVPDALAELERHAGTQFDARCVEALRDILGSGASQIFTPGASIVSGTPPISA